MGGGEIIYFHFFLSVGFGWAKREMSLWKKEKCWKINIVQQCRGCVRHVTRRADTRCRLTSAGANVWSKMGIFSFFQTLNGKTPCVHTLTQLQTPCVSIPRGWWDNQKHEEKWNWCMTEKCLNNKTDFCLLFFFFQCGRVAILDASGVDLLLIWEVNICLSSEKRWCQTRETSPETGSHTSPTGSVFQWPQNLLLVWMKTRRSRTKEQN